MQTVAQSRGRILAELFQGLITLMCLKGQCHEIFDFVWTPCGSRVNLQTHFCLQVRFKVSAAWYCSHYLPHQCLGHQWQVCAYNWHRWQICCRCRWFRGQFCQRCRWHRWQMCHQGLWYRCCTLTYLREFTKKFKTVLKRYSGLGGNWFMKKPEAKTLVTLSL
jgi:hypothetical protein